jgi:hypothetical protein
MNSARCTENAKALRDLLIRIEQDARRVEVTLEASGADQNDLKVR